MGKLAENTVTDVAAIGMIYLDVLAQQKGYSPVADCVWNMISEPELFSDVNLIS